jgi:hypothetical protein
MISKILATLSILAGVGLLLLTVMFLILGSGAALAVPGERDSERNIASVDKHFEATPTPTSELVDATPTPAATPIADPTSTNPELKRTAFEWLWPRELSTQDEGTVTFSAITVAERELPDLNASPREGVGSTRPSLGLPDKPLASAFGPGYTAAATASLDAPSFKKTPEGDVAKMLDEGDARWQWIVTPQSEGSKLMTVRVKVDWIGTDQAHPPKQREWSKSLKTEVKKPLVRVGTFELIPWLTGLSGTTLLGVGAFIFGKGKFGKKDEQAS